MMITAHDEESLINTIQGLSELEFAALLSQMAAHLRRNNWEHIIDDCFDIKTYEQELDEANERIEGLRDKLRSAEGKLDEIRDIL